MGWQVQELANGQVHVAPDTDGRLHELDPDCWCQPDPPSDNSGVFVHRDQLDREVTVP